jgi:hypothetical protein
VKAKARTAGARFRARQGCDRTVACIKQTSIIEYRSGRAREPDRAPYRKSTSGMSATCGRTPRRYAGACGSSNDQNASPAPFFVLRCTING